MRNRADLRTRNACNEMRVREQQSECYYTHLYGSIKVRALVCSPQNEYAVIQSIRAINGRRHEYGTGPHEIGVKIRQFGGRSPGGAAAAQKTFG